MARRRNNMVVLLDGECTMCSCFGQFVSAFDPMGTFRFASQQSMIGDEVMEHCEGAKAHALNTILVCDLRTGTFDTTTARNPSSTGRHETFDHNFLQRTVGVGKSKS